MLAYERRVTAALLSTDDPEVARSIEEFVGGSLGAMPEVLRFGIGSLSVALGSWSRLRSLVGAGRSGADEVIWLRRHPVGLVRQWVRALGSLVLFAEQESLGGVQR